MIKRFRYYKLFILCVSSLVLKSQSNLPIIQATSKNVIIIDGNHYKPNYWVIFPETKPDIYYVELPQKAQSITFITDIDSITFDYKKGDRINFIILLNNKDSCFTQISANYPKSLNLTNSKSKATSNPESDTIPFTLKKNLIYIAGRINNSKNSNIQFDLGAGGLGMGFINYKSVDKVDIQFDKSTFLLNDQGNNQARLSSKNKLQIGSYTFKDIEIVETKNMRRYEDLIIGNGLFLNKILEINYDKNMLVVHDHLPPMDIRYKKFNMILDNGVRPAVEAAFQIDGIQYKDWFLFDTGNTGSGIINKGYLQKNNIYKKFSTIFALKSKAFAKSPILLLGGERLKGGTITLEKSYENGVFPDGGGLLGNEILQKFNVVIDNRNGFIYFKPNKGFQKIN